MALSLGLGSQAHHHTRHFYLRSEDPTQLFMLTRRALQSLSHPLYLCITVSIFIVPYPGCCKDLPHTTEDALCNCVLFFFPLEGRHIWFWLWVVAYNSCILIQEAHCSLVIRTLFLKLKTLLLMRHSSQEQITLQTFSQLSLHGYYGTHYSAWGSVSAWCPGCGSLQILLLLSFCLLKTLPKWMEGEPACPRLQ